MGGGLKGAQRPIVTRPAVLHSAAMIADKMHVARRTGSEYLADKRVFRDPNPPCAAVGPIESRILHAPAGEPQRSRNFRHRGTPT